jgi:hypothetical protein
MKERIKGNRDYVSSFLASKKANAEMDSLLSKLRGMGVHCRVRLYHDDEASDPDVVVQYFDDNLTLKEICSAVKDGNLRLLDLGVRVNFVKVA